MRSSTYDPGKSQEKIRLTNIDVEITGTEDNKSANGDDRMTQPFDVVDPIEQTWSDEDERMNDHETRKTPCSEHIMLFDLI